MFRIFIFTLIIFIIFSLAYKILASIFRSHEQKVQFLTNSPNSYWSSIYKPIGIISACAFAIITHYFFTDTQYLLAFFSVLSVGGSIWLYREC